MEHNESPLGDLESTLKTHAAKLVENLERGRFGEAVRLISELSEVRDRGLYQEVGKLTRELHNAIVNFEIDMAGAEHAEDEMSQITDATQRLNYVVTMTEKAANRTMDLVEQSAPLANDLAEDARVLHQDWQKFMRKELSASAFRDLAKRVDAFLGRVDKSNAQLSANLSDILLAQDFQDLTGQVIKRVTALVTEVEDNLVKLVMMASSVDRYVGIEHDHEQLREEAKQDKPASAGEGPQMNADKREDVVSGQDDVDDLLSSLGF